MIALCDDSGRGHGGETMLRFKGAQFVKDIILRICRKFPSEGYLG
jgi:hypothetical protein